MKSSKIIIADNARKAEVIFSFISITQEGSFEIPFDINIKERVFTN